MINIDELKPIIQPLLDGRDDAASVIESITAIDKDIDPDADKIAAINKDWNDRYMAAFFGQKKAEILEDGSGVTIEPTGETEKITDPAAEPDEDPGETISLQEVIDKQEDEINGDEKKDKED